MAVASIDWLPGEESVCAAKYVKHRCVYTEREQIGTLTLTNYQLVFCSDEKDGIKTRLAIPHATIGKIEKSYDYQAGLANFAMRSEKSVTLKIFCKDMRSARFDISQDTQSKKTMVEQILQYTNPLKYNKKFFAYSYNEKFSFDGWSVYDPEKEYGRMGIPSRTDTWTLSKINRDFEFCDTYPQSIVVPTDWLKDDGGQMLRKAAAFRSKNRLPVLSWIHPVSSATITRCSQPMVGLTGRQNDDDEEYLKHILDLSPRSSKLYIADARPRRNAMANKGRGGGYEKDYANCDIKFYDIANIHAMRGSLEKLKDVCFHVDENKFLEYLDNTRWLEHIRRIMSGAATIADRVENYHMPVVCHCSDGWDRTGQLVALALLMLDPYYRTIIGFEVLIEKEWIQVGHKFAQRVGHGSDQSEVQEQAPIFEQFIDCVWQLTQQFPQAFEFNEDFLLTILEHLYSCRFGTFLKNCERERDAEKTRQQTISLWSFTNSNIDRFRNPFYAQQSRNHVIIPNASMRTIKFWKRYYLKWHPVHCSRQERTSLRMFDLNKIYSRLVQRVASLDLSYGKS